MIKGIKKALNTTVGTKNFQPLDKIIDNAIKLVPSIENRIYHYGEAEVGYPNGVVIKRTANCAGGCYLGYAVRSIRDESITTRIYINDALIIDDFFSKRDPDADERVYYPFWFEKGDEIKVEIIPSAQKRLTDIGFYAIPTKRNVLVEVIE